jgi:hypothetical protein
MLTLSISKNLPRQKLRKVMLMRMMQVQMIKKKQKKLMHQNLL